MDSPHSDKHSKSQDYHVESTDSPITTTNVNNVSEEQQINTSTSTKRTIIDSVRSRVVSKDDIESIRGRALNFTSAENTQQQKFSGVVYVTAPTTSSLLSKTSKSLKNDLSDVDMEDNFQSSEQATTTIPLIHELDCQTKVSFFIIYFCFVCFD